jgi:hypothetical protein
MSECREVRVNGVQIPVPEAITATLESSRTVIQTREYIFRLGGIELRTCVVDGRQHTVAFFPGAPGEGQRIGVTIGPAEPPKTKVGRLVDALE